MSILIYLDTHVVLWIHSGLTERLTGSVVQLLNTQELRVSPIVRLELQYLYEIGRYLATPQIVLSSLKQRIGLLECDKRFEDVIIAARPLEWTRDPFDRIIVAHASIDDNILISKDTLIREKYTYARW